MQPRIRRAMYRRRTARTLYGSCLILSAFILWLATCAGCASTDALDETPLAQPLPAAAISCEDSAPLEVPSGANSAQLDEILYAAYLDARAHLTACIKATEPDHE